MPWAPANHLQHATIERQSRKTPVKPARWQPSSIGMRLRELLVVSALVGCGDPAGADVILGSPGNVGGMGGASGGSAGTTVGAAGSTSNAGAPSSVGHGGAAGQGSEAPDAGYQGPVAAPDAGTFHDAGGEDAGTLSGDAAAPSCPFGSYDSDANPETPCSDWTVCEPGQYVIRDGDPTRDRSCAGCPTGTFSSEDNAESCEPWRDCGIDTVVAELPSASQDRGCEPCAAGTYAEQPNLSECVEVGECAPGTRVVAPAGQHTPPQCSSCAAGSFCPGGDTPELPCSGQEWDHDANPATACAPLTVCLAGQYVDEAGTSTSNRSCEPCQLGSYSSEDNAPECTEHEPCEAGSEQIEEGTSTTPALCAPCEPGSFCSGGDEPEAPCQLGTWDHDADPGSACEEQTSCEPGQYVTSTGDATTDRECEDCEAGSYASGFNASSCETWRDCQPGSYVATAPSQSNDRQCTSCPGTYLSATINAPVCDPIGISICSGMQPTLVWDATVSAYTLDTAGGLSKDNSTGWNHAASSSAAAFGANDDFCFEHIAIAQNGYNQIMFGVRFDGFSGNYLSAGTYLDARNHYYFGAGAQDQFTLFQTNGATVGTPLRYSIRRQGNTLTVAVNGTTMYQSSGASWLQSGRPAALLYNDITRIESASGQ